MFDFLNIEKRIFIFIQIKAQVLKIIFFNFSNKNRHLYSIDLLKQTHASKMLL